MTSVRRHGVTPFATMLAVLALSATLGAQVEPDRARVDLPPDRTGPVPVEIDFFLLDVTAVNGADETFSAKLYFEMRWKDPRQAFVPAAGATRIIYTGGAADEQLNQIWSPGVSVQNETAAPEVSDQVLTIYADGTVDYEARMNGVFQSAMDLRRFPFDTQTLHVGLESFLWQRDELILVPMKTTGGSPRFGEGLAVRDWTIVDARAEIADKKYVTGDTTSQFIATLVVRRNPWFTMWSVVFPLVLVTFFAITCFFWGPDTLTERVAQVLACLLTVTAQNLVTAGDLPKINYFTPIDYAFLLTYTILLVVTIESIYVRRVSDRDPARAARIDRIYSYAVGLVYAIGLIVIFLIR